MTRGKGLRLVAPGRSLSELTKLSSRELLRNVKTVVALTFMFFFFLLVMAGIDLFINGGRESPVVSVASSSNASLEHELDSRGIQVIRPDEKGATARVDLRGDRARVVLSGSPRPAWKGVVAAIHATGIPRSQITVVDSDGSPEVDILQVNLPTVLVTGFMAIAFMGTSVPLVTLRQRGVLRLLGTTPVKRLTFILSQAPIRFALGMTEALIVLSIAWSQNYVESLSVLRLLVTLLVGLAMLFAFAYLLASRSSNPEVMNQITGFVPLLAIMTSGTVFPLDAFPDVFRYVTYAFPTTWFMQAVSFDVASTTPFLSVYWL